MPWNKTDRSFKTLINKRVTDSDAKYSFNEKGDFTANIHQIELWMDSIPGTAPGATTDIVEYHNTLTLVEDTSVPSKQTWFATSNSSTAPAQTDETSRLKNWVSDKYGSTYEIILYDGSDVQVPPSDGCGWFFDYQTGILTFASATTTTGGGGTLSSRAPFKVKGYRYIGRTGLDGNIIKNEVRVATIPATSFSGWSYSSELIDTGVTSATLSIDGVSLNSTEGVNGDRVLIKDWSTLANNGIYYVERAGDGASDTWRFRRSPDFNDSQDIFAGTMAFVRSGTVNARTVWSMTNTAFTTLDAGGATGEVVFTQSVTATTRWNSITAPVGNLSLAMSTYTTQFNWSTGTSTNNLLSLTTDASANGTGVLLNIATGASSTIVPFRVRRDSTDYLTVNATGGVLVGSLTSTRIVFAGGSGLLQDSANLTFDGNRVSLATTGNTGGLLIGGDANLYRSAADVLSTDDSLVVGVNLTVSSLTTTRVPFASTSGLLVDSAAFVYTTGTGQLALSTTGSGAGLLLGGDAQLYRSAADILRTPDSFTVDQNLTVSGSASIGASGGTVGTVSLVGSSSGVVDVKVLAAAGTWTMTLPNSGGTSGYVLSTNGSGATSWSAPGIPWTEVTGTSTTAVAHNGYIANNAGLVTITLPTPAVGSVIEIVGLGAGGWKAQCAASHTIRLGNIISASTGYVASTNQYDTVKIVGVSSTQWHISSVVGTLDVV